METQIGRIVTFLAQYAQINFTKNLYLRNIQYKHHKSKFDTFRNFLKALIFLQCFTVNLHWLIEMLKQLIFCDSGCLRYLFEKKKKKKRYCIIAIALFIKFGLTRDFVNNIDLEIYGHKVNTIGQQQARNQEFFREGEFSWSQGTLINIHQLEKEKPHLEKISTLFAWKFLKIAFQMRNFTQR